MLTFLDITQGGVNEALCSRSIPNGLAKQVISVEEIYLEARIEHCVIQKVQLSIPCSITEDTDVCSWVIGCFSSLYLFQAFIVWGGGPVTVPSLQQLYGTSKCAKGITHKVL